MIPAGIRHPRLALLGATLVLALFPGVVLGAELFGSDYLAIEGPPYIDRLWPGDFNGDGRRDVLCRADDGLWVIPGRRAGGFDPPILRLSGDVPIQISTFDATGDGITDVIGINPFPSRIVLFPGRAGGGFADVIPVDGGDDPERLVSGDFNGDGFPDLAASFHAADPMRIWLTAGSAAWGAPILLDVPDTYRELATGDWSGDGRTDLVVTDGERLFGWHVDGAAWPDTLEPMNASGLGSFEEGSLAVADFDRDGLPDLAARTGYRSVGVHRQSSLGRWDDVATFEVESDGELTRLLALDFDADGWIDIVALERSENQLHVLRNDGGGDFRSAISPSLPSGVSAMAHGEWIAGSDQLAVGTYSGTVAFLDLGATGRVQRTSLRQPGAPGENVVVADIDEDGRADLVVGSLDSPESGSMVVHFNRGDRTFETVEFQTGFPPERLLVVDITGDRHLDVLALSRYRDAIWVFEGDGRGHFDAGREAYRGRLGYLAGVVGLTADIDGDGDADIVLPGPTNECWLFRNNGNGDLGQPLVRPLTGDITGLVLARSPAAGRAEIYALTYSPGVIYTLRGSDSGAFDVVRYQDSVSRSFQQSLADVNGDCIDDFVLQVGRFDRVSIQYGLGGGRFGPPEFERLGRPLDWVVAGDLDGDSRDDLVAYAGEAGLLQVRRGSSDGLRDVSEFAVGAGLVNPLLEDLDGDGQPDLVAIDWGTDQLRVIWNQAVPIPAAPGTGSGNILFRISNNASAGPFLLDIDGLVAGEPLQVSVFDIQGRPVMTRSLATVPSARTCVAWNGRTDGGRAVASGVYPVRVASAGRTHVGRVIVVR